MKSILAWVAVAGVAAVLGAGCTCVEVTEGGVSQTIAPGASLLDVPWVNPAMQFKTGAAEAQLESARLEAPNAYTEDLKGRVSTGGAPNLPMLPSPELETAQLPPLSALNMEIPLRVVPPPLPIGVDISKSPVIEDPTFPIVHHDM